MLLDKPLIAYTIIAALDSGVFDKVIVSTDSKKYKDIAESFGAEVIMRDARYSSDTSTTYTVIEHALRKIKQHYDYFALLQPTSPFRNAFHIKEAVDRFEKSKSFDFLVSVTESTVQSCLIKPIDDDLSLKYYNLDYSNYRRQNCMEYHPNGAIFLGKISPYFKQKHFFGEKTLSYIMDRESSVDIDDRLDFELAIALANKINKKEILKQSILAKIEERKSHISSNSADITLIGHSLFDNWSINEISGLKVNNFGIAGINTVQYINYILENKIIKDIGRYVFVFAGTNDIVDADWTIEKNIKEIQTLIDKIKFINNGSTIFLFTVPPVRGRLDRDNITIEKLNIAIKKNIFNCNIIDLSPDFSDEYNDLKSDYTHDGLHFTDKAYKKLKNIIEAVLK